MASSSKPTVKELISQVGLKDESKLHKPCSDQDLKVIVKYCEQWRKIGHHLGLSKIQIEDIDKEKKAEEEKRSTMLATWKQIYSFKATFKALVDALYECECTQGAYQVCEHLTHQETEELDEAVSSSRINNTADTNENKYTQNTSLQNLVAQATYPAHNAQIKTTKEELEAKFTKIIDEFGDSISCVPIDTVRKSAASLPESVRKDLSNPSDAIHSMIGASSTVEFLTELNLHSKYITPSLLQHMVDRHGSERCRQLMGEYLETLQVYRRTTTIKEHINKQDDNGIECKEFTEKLGSDWEDKTLEDLVHHLEREYLCNSLLGLSR